MYLSVPGFQPTSSVFLGESVTCWAKVAELLLSIFCKTLHNSNICIHIFINILILRIILLFNYGSF